MKAFFQWIWKVMLVIVAVAGAIILGRRDGKASDRNQEAAGKAKEEAEAAADQANELNRDADAREKEAVDIRDKAEKELDNDKGNAADIVDRWRVRKPPR